MKNILVTGVAGFLGSHVADYLVKAGHRVFGLDDLSGGFRENISQDVHFIFGSIEDSALVNRICYHVHMDAVIHCAAFASEILSHQCRVHTYRSIVLGSANLVNAAINNGTELFVTMSSIAVYGKQRPPFDEDMPLLPSDPYGAAKACMEADVRAAYENYGMNYVVFRPHNIIGTRQSLADSTRNAVSIFIRQALEERPLTIFGDGQQTRAFSPVQDIAPVMAGIVERHDCWNHTYNIGGDQSFKILDIARIVCEQTGTPESLVHLPPRNEAMHAISQHGRLRIMYGDVPKSSVVDTISQMVIEARRRALPPIQPLPPIDINFASRPTWNHKP